MPKEGTKLAAQQKEFEEKLALQGGTVTPNEDKLVAEAEGKEEEVAKEDPGDLELEDSELGGLEVERQDDENGRDSGGFFYEEEEEEEQEDVDMGIGARVAARRQGHLHSRGGQME